jgi:hypothetical protein
MTGSRDAGNHTPAAADSHWDLCAEPLAGAVFRASLRADGVTMRFADVIGQWKHSEVFRAFWTASLADVPFEAYCLELPALSRDTLGRPFECVFVESRALARTAPDPTPFSDHFRKDPACEVAVFDNLGADALLVAPCPRADPHCYTHLAAFARCASREQADALWRATAEAFETRLGNAPVWLSTAGLGVYWLHLRLDSRPKYYRHTPYTDAGLPGSG